MSSRILRRRKNHGRLQKTYEDSITCVPSTRFFAGIRQTGWLSPVVAVRGRCLRVARLQTLAREFLLEPGLDGEDVGHRRTARSCCVDLRHQWQDADLKDLTQSYRRERVRLRKVRTVNLAASKDVVSRMPPRSCRPRAGCGVLGFASAARTRKYLLLVRWNAG